MAENSEELDFLTRPTPERIRKEVNNVIDSYNHPWDFLAELCQNAVDAIREFEEKFNDVEKDHEITIRIDSINRTVEVKDTGIGFPCDEATHLLAPHGTNKEQNLDQIGTKGIGLTYTIFCCNKFSLESKSACGKIEGEINGGSAWRKGVEDMDIPSFKGQISTEEEIDPSDFFTKITLVNIEETFAEEEDIFNQTLPVLEYILRTKTAIGNVRGIFENSSLKQNLSIKLVHVSKDGEENEVPIDFCYKLPTEHVDNSDILDYDEFITEAASLSDDQKTEKLKGKTLVKDGKFERGGREINYKAIFFTSRNTYEEISEKADINTEGRYQFRGGIWLGTKGMPTGIELTPPSSGSAGYWPNFYLLLEDNSLKFDLGRKSIPGRTKGMLRDIAKEVFNKFTRFESFFSGKSKTRRGPSGIYQKEISEEFDDLRNYSSLNLDGVNYLKTPHSQEAGVVAIFHELVGAGLLKGYYGLRSSYQTSYDFWCEYRISEEEVGEEYKDKCEDGTLSLDTVIEFKHDGEDIIDDLEENRKFFEDISLLVCWDFDEDDFSEENISVKLLEPEERLFHGSNYKLEFPGALNLGSAGVKHMLSLRRFIEDKIRS